jgi:hypothetical protein
MRTLAACSASSITRSRAQLELGKTTYPVNLPYSRPATSLPMTNLD